MPDSEIKNWADIKENFQDADILIGNGFSINLNPSFNYTSLFETFLQSLPIEKATIYKKMNNSNFESILKDFQKVARINKLFSIDYNPIKEALLEIRSGLVTAITTNHPTKVDIDKIRLLKIGKELSFFGDIFTLNYDLLLYHTILLMNDYYEEKDEDFRYSDFFWKSLPNNFLGFGYPQNYSNRGSIYYLHGAIFLFNDGFDAIKLKLNSSENEILDSIKKAINRGVVPLFISEGTSKEKSYLIRQNEYLTRCISDLAYRTDTLVIYGASLLSQDNHIVNAINFKEKRKIAISLYIKRSSQTCQKEEILRFKSLFVNQELYFFDSSTLFN